MNKIWLIIQREYLTRVRKKSFLITTILVPLIIIGFYAAIIAIAVSDTSKTDKIAVIDEANIFEGKIPSEKDEENTLKFDFIKNETEESFKKKYEDQGYSLFLFVPPVDVKNPTGINLHSQSSVSLNTKNKVERAVDKAIERKRLLSENIDPQKYESIKSNVEIPTKIDSKEGEKKGVEGIASAVAFAAGILIYIVLMIYGSMVMRGVAEEKTSRISEVIISSVKPFQLMFGKIVGIGAVGITQFIIWIILIGVLQLILPLVMPGLGDQIANAPMQGNIPMTGNASMVAKVTEGLQSLDLGLILFCFIFYFIGGYLMYSSLFAAVGSVVSEDPQEAQQLIFPIMMPIIFGFVIMMKAVQDPNSGLAVFGSLFPLTSPIVMMGRVTFGVPWTQLVLSMALLIVTFLFCTWMAGKIYRTGILMYGKRPTWKEMMKWTFRRS
ncbi:MAG TPA: ABC transporter permease [Chitinophagaceae bacterium]|nr:ABC transporter permease [Chitinophagaceae bacterium]